MPSNFRRKLTAVLLGAALAPGLVISSATHATADGHAKTHTVVIKNFVYKPARLRVKAGDSIKFVNQDSAPHTATSTKGLFDTGRLERGQSATIKVSQKATMDYFCAIHPRMKAKIVVR